MDVTCERCGTEYEFDDALVGDRGTNVKCTNCGYVFRVGRADATGNGANAWTIRCTDGRTLTIPSMGELQQLIAKGELSEADEISRSGEQWKPLGSIAELRAVFLDGAATAVGRNSVVSQAPSPFKMETPFGKAPSSPPQKRTSTGPMQNPASHRPSQAGTVINGTTTSSETVAEGSARTRRGTIAAWGNVSSSAPPPPDGSATTMAAEPRPPQAAADAPRRLYVDEADESAWPSRKTEKASAGKWVAAVVLIVVGAAAAVYFYPPLRTAVGLGAPATITNPVLDAAGEALALDDEPGYAAAEQKFTAAMDADKGDANAVAHLALTYAVWAQALLFDAGDLDARAAKAGAPGTEAATLRKRAAGKANDAMKYADQALSLAASNVTALLAKADALRLTGDPSGARAQLTRAARLQESLSADHHRIAALLDVAENDNDITAARAEAERAVDADEHSIRARLLLARVYIAKGDVAEARNQLAEILATAPSNGPARKLTEALDKGLPPAPPVIAVVDAGVPAAPQATPDAGSSAAPAPVPAATANAPAPTASASAAPPKDYSGYIEAGDKALDADDLTRAEENYRQALALRSTASEALTGLGYVALARQNYAEAQRRFEPAMRNGYADAYIGLGDTFRRLDKLDEAMEAYQGYLRRLPGGPSAGIAQRQIEALQARKAAETPPSPPPNTQNPYDTPANAPLPSGTPPENTP